MSKAATQFKPGSKRPEGAGRKKGSKNKNPITLDLVQTLKDLGHNPAAVQVEIFKEAWARFKTAMRSKHKYGAATALDVAMKANSELLKYVYPTRKAIEGANGESLTFAGMIQIIEGEDNEPHAE